MRPLWLLVVGGGGRGRPLLVALATSLVSGLLLVAASYARLGGWGDQGAEGHLAGPSGLDARMLGPIADPGTRGGAITAVVLLVLPVALLLDQCVRLGAAAQQRRYLALAVAGATRRDLRRWGALETGAPAAVGALLGVVVFLLLRLLLGSVPAELGLSALVPTATGPGWWTLPVLLVVAAYGVLVGVRAARGVTVDRGPAPEPAPPRPWGPAVLVVAAVLVLLTVTGSTDLLLLVGAALVVVGAAASASWVAYRMSGRALRTTHDPAALLAARRIRADHGAAGRAAAASGGIGLTLGVVGAFVGDLTGEPEGISDIGYYLVPALLVGVLALVAVGIVALSLTLHSVEATLARRREVAALVAGGVPLRTLEDATAAECRLATLPMASGAAVLGAIFGIWRTSSALGAVVGVAVTVVAVLLAARLAARLVRPWLREAAATANLRTG